LIIPNPPGAIAAKERKEHKEAESGCVFQEEAEALRELSHGLRLSPVNLE
jgi:hypothetical protein